MTIQITVIGLGQIGSSIGLALQTHKDKIYRCGHDPDPVRAKKVEKLGAFDKTFFNLPESVREADIVVLALPVDQIQETLKYISEDLKPGVVVIDTAPIRIGVDQWVKASINSEGHFVSMVPTINPVYLDEKSEDLETPHANLFTNGEMILATDITTHPDAVKLAVDLAELLGSSVYIVDPLEADGITARVDLLPKLVAAAYINSTIDQPGWKDSRRFTSRAFQKATSSIELLDEKDQLGESAILNHKNIIVTLDQMIVNLVELKSIIQEKDQKSLSDFLKKAKDGRSFWVEHRKAGDWEKYLGDKPPSSKQMMGGLFGIRPKNKNSK